MLFHELSFVPIFLIILFLLVVLVWLFPETNDK
jgi:hypothetical protein